MLTESKKQIVLKIPANAEEKSLDEFYRDLDKLKLKASHDVNIDCSALNNVSSRHVMIIWQAFNRCKTIGASVKLISVSPALVHTLKLLDIYDLLTEGYETDPIRKSTSGYFEESAPLSLRLKFKPLRKDIRNALVEFQSLLESWNLLDLHAFELAMVFYEVVTNIRLHGNLKSSGNIEFHARIINSEIEMQFTDTGIAYDPTKKSDDFNPIKAIKTGQKNGLGLTLIKRSTDKQIYSRIDDKMNVLRISKVIKLRGTGDDKSANHK